MDNFDFSTPEGMKKAVITIIGILATVLISAFGWSPDKANTLVTILTQFAPIIATVLYYVVNQIASSGKAKAVTNQAKIVADAQVALAQAEVNKINAKVALAVVSEEPQKIPEPQKVEISLVKDRVNLMREYYAQGKNYREWFIGAVGATINKWLQHMVEVNPQVTSVEMAKEIAKEFFNRTLTEAECATIQGILGLEAIIKSMGDEGILAGFFVAFDKFPQLAYLEEVFRQAAIHQSTIDLIHKAASRVNKGDINMASAKLALREFDISESDVEKSQWSGNLCSAVYKINGYIPFEPFALAGFTPEGDPF